MLVQLAIPGIPSNKAWISVQGRATRGCFVLFGAFASADLGVGRSSSSSPSSLELSVVFDFVLYRATAFPLPVVDFAESACAASLESPTVSLYSSSAYLLIRGDPSCVASVWVPNWASSSPSPADELSVAFSLLFGRAIERWAGLL